MISIRAPWYDENLYSKDAEIYDWSLLERYLLDHDVQTDSFVLDLLYLASRETEFSVEIILLSNEDTTIKEIRSISEMDRLLYSTKQINLIFGSVDAELLFKLKYK